MSNQEQIRQKITDQVIAALRAGTQPPWVCPWQANLENTGHPANAATGRRYSGVNVLALLIASQVRWTPLFGQKSGVRKRGFDNPVSLRVVRSSGLVGPCVAE
jgi:N-terminal domain of anti-restriction factor ArdC